MLKLLLISLSDQNILDENNQKLTEEEVEKLLFNYNSYLLSILTYKLNNSEIAEDILQDTYLSFLASKEKREIKFSTDKKIKNYLTTIALNKVKDFYKSQGYKQKKNHTFSTTEELESFLENYSSNVYLPEEEIISKEKESLVKNSIAVVMESLPTKYRRILDLKFNREKDNKEISKVLNISVKAVESLLFRAKRKFKKELEKYSVDKNEYLH